MAATSGLMSSNLVTLFNNTTTTSVYSNTTLPSSIITANSLNHSTTWQHNATGSLAGIQNSSVRSNYSEYTTIGPLLITYTYSYSYDYAYYAFMFILLIAALVCIKIGISRRKEAERRAAAQRIRVHQVTESGPVTRASNDNNNSSNNNNNSSAITKEFDLPPAYDEVVQSYILSKQSAQTISINDGPTGITTNSTANTISASVSTLTIETEISNSNHVSSNSLNNSTIVS